MGSAQFVGLGIPKFAMEYFSYRIRIKIRICNTEVYFYKNMKSYSTMTFVLVYYKTELNTSDMSDFVHPTSHIQVFFCSSHIW